MQKGYGVFGRAYEVMLRNDLHAPQSIDHRLMREMILVSPESYAHLYGQEPALPNMEEHELHGFAQRFRGSSDRETIANVLAYTSDMAGRYDVDFSRMRFGGTEKQILERGTDWCVDMARAAAVLLACLDIPARFVELANLEKAYNGHAVIEAFYEGKYGVCDPIYGYCFYNGQPLDTWTLLNDRSCLEGCPEEYAQLYTAAAISEYDPLDPDNDYTVSGPNKYYLRMMDSGHNGTWLMGEDA